MRKQRGTCSVAGCGKPHWARTWCQTHYHRWLTTGSIEVKLRPRGAGCFSRGYHTLQKDGVQQAVHIRVAEAALGKALPRGAVVHHANEDKSDNRPENLVICTQAYHRFLHQRMSAHKACGHADWRRCRFCKTHDDPANLKIVPGARLGASATIYHKECARIASNKRYHARKAVA